MSTNLKVGSLSSHFQAWIPPGKWIAVSGSLNRWDRWHIIPQIGSIYHLYTTYIPLIYHLYTTYIPLIYHLYIAFCGGYMLPTSTYHLLREPETTKQPRRKLPHPKSPADLRSWSLAIEFGTLWNAYFQWAQGHLERGVGGFDCMVPPQKMGSDRKTKKMWMEEIRLTSW